MTKKVRSALQLAADRVRDMEVAVAKTRSNLKICLADFEVAKLAYETASRNMYDTMDFLSAQQSKLGREVASVQEIINFAGHEE